MSHQVVILGGGFGGLSAARALRRAEVRVTLIDRRNFHLFQPLLYQVATGGLSPANIAAPLRGVLRRQRNAAVVLAEVKGLDVDRRQVILDEGPMAYDTLIVATGVRHHYFGNDHWRPLAPGLKTVEDATEIRSRILSAFEAAEHESDAEKVKRLLTFVVVGGGPTGVELAGALGELAQHTLRRDFRHIDTTTARVVLIEGVDRVLPTYPPLLSAKAERALKRLGVEVRTSCRVTAVEEHSLTLSDGQSDERLSCQTVLWAAGVKASSPGAWLAASAEAETDRSGRVIVGPDCSLPQRPEIFVIGDLANFQHGRESPLPGVAPVAIQQGRYAARVIRDRLRGKQTRPFRYKDRGNMATIGRAAAVAELYSLRFNGIIAWLTWLFVHLIFLIGFQNRLLVLTQWFWNYITRNRAARLITGEKQARQYEHGAPASESERDGSGSQRTES